VATLAERYDAFLLDLDGVLYRADEPVKGAAEAVDELRALGKRIAFVTNNSSRTSDQVAEKLAHVGVSAGPEEVVTSGMATALVLAERGGGSAFVIGEDGIRSALAEVGMEILDGEPDRADYVVVGWDRGATYERLRTAALLVQRGASLVATNADPSYPAPEGMWPGAGALLAALITTLGRPADQVVGKPHPTLYRIAAERAGGGRALVVGDRLDTDIAGAAPLGWDSLLVLTGVAGPGDVIRSRALPTYLGDDLAVLGLDLPTVRPAWASDGPSIGALLRAGALSTEGIDARIKDTCVAEGEGGVLGTASLEVFGEAAHLRSVAVAPDRRGTNVGTLLAATVAGRARDRGSTDLYAVTEEAAGFFERLGFRRIGGKEALPGAIASTPLVREHCSSTSVAFRLELTGSD
jgi:glycerol 3-phosphatase-2